MKTGVRFLKMNFFKRIVSVFLCLVMVYTSAFVFASGVSAAEVGTKENPANANDKYMAAVKSYIMNVDLAEGNTDGYWYTLKVESSGYLCIDATARDASGNMVENYQVTVETKGVTYKAFDEIYTRPIVPFRSSKGDTVTIHIESTPDETGIHPFTKIYCSAAIVAATESEPISVKGDEGFVANVRAGREMYCIDGTNGGFYGMKGLYVTANNGTIDQATITVSGVEYTDLDGDGAIELTLPGDTSSQIPLHPSFTIYNASTVDTTYTLKAIDPVFEGPADHTTEHAVAFVKEVAPCHKTGVAAHWYCSECDAYWADEALSVITNVKKLAIPAVKSVQYVSATDSTCSENGICEHWYCDGCKTYYADADGKAEIAYEELLKAKLEHSFEFVKIAVDSTFTENGKALYKCSACSAEKFEDLPLLEHWDKGDLNNDGKVNALDSNLLKRVFTGDYISDQGRDAGDLNNDGKINAIDSNMLVNIILGQ